MQEFIPLIVTVIPTVLGSVTSLIFNRRAKKLSVAAESLDQEVQQELQDVLKKESSDQAPPQNEIDRTTADVETKTAKKDSVVKQRDHALTVSLIGAVASVVAAVSVPFAAGYVNEPAIACPEQIEKVISIVEKHPGAWVPLNADDEYQISCHLNEVANQVKAAAKQQSQPTAEKSVR